MNEAPSQSMPLGDGVQPGASRRLAQLRATMALSLRVERRKKRIWVMALVALLPVVPPFAFLVVDALLPGERRFGTSAMSFFRYAMGIGYFNALYVLALVYGPAAVSDEVEGKTLVHLLLRPIPRWVLVVGKFLSAWIVSAALLVASLVLMYALIWPTQKGEGIWREAFRWDNLRVFLVDTLILVFALGAYLSLFTCLGAWFRHGERVGVVFCFGWEYLVTYLPANLKYLTLRNHVETLVPHSIMPWRAFSLRGEPLSKPACVLILFAVMAAGLALTIRTLKRKEIR